MQIVHEKGQINYLDFECRKMDRVITASELQIEKCVNSKLSLNQDKILNKGRRLEVNMTLKLQKCNNSISQYKTQEISLIKTP